jgi:hypothetical protein
MLLAAGLNYKIINVWSEESGYDTYTMVRVRIVP